jgi:tripartite-type tricarboxylate transporter receptor subunit TctC
MLNRRMLLALAGTGLAMPAVAQPLTVTLIVPFSPGSVVDIMARGFADPFRLALGAGANVPVLNREGAGGGVGVAAVGQARPDGTTIAFAPSGMITTLPHLVNGLPYRFEGFEAICQNFENIFVLAVGAQSPHRDLPGLLAAARARPETVTWGDAGVGTVGNLIGRQLEQLAGVKMSPVPYRNQGQMMLDVQSGALDAAITTWATVRDSGLRVLGVAADARQPAIPDGPTFGEMGLNVTLRGFGGLYAPRGLPREVARRLEVACLEATASPAYREAMARIGQVVAPLGAEAFAVRLRDEERDAKGMIERLGLRAP